MQRDDREAEFFQHERQPLGLGHFGRKDDGGFLWELGDEVDEVDVLLGCWGGNILLAEGGWGRVPVESCITR